MKNKPQTTPVNIKSSFVERETQMVDLCLKSVYHNNSILQLFKGVSPVQLNSQ